MAKQNSIKKEYDLLSVIDKTNEIIKKAKKNNNSIKGTNHYAKKFLENSVNASQIMRKIKTKVSGIVDDKNIKDLSENIEAYFDSSNTNTQRKKAQRSIIEIFTTKIQPNLDDKQTHSPTDELFPLELIKNTKPYLEKIGIQAAGCYDQKWYDGCAVMMRRLLENLIIECFESKKIVEKIKNTDGNFFYLSDLITKFLAEDGKKWNPTRNCKTSIPKLKDLGDKSAHSRYFTARQKDVIDVKNDFRLVMEELVNISEL